MAIIKCKMCGGDMELSADRSVGTCEYCGSTMTIPKLDDDRRAAAFDRGNHFRRVGEFDKALSVYERIVQEDDADAEAHWCCALCRFGIEYVKDPASGEYLPTCHRASFDSFLEDVDYQAALARADAVAKQHYQAEGEKIAAVQRGILSISQQEQPFDVFICYKETDDKGQRTVDSTLAQDIYYQLTEQGRRVFFARITLEDKAGQEYEPYIFAALHSAKVMVVVGTKPEYLSAVWVKNEWSRYLALMKADHKRLLIPCYRDMDPYDLPEQLSVLQSYDMSKIGFIQDLIRGVGKVLDADKKPEPAARETVVVQGESGNLRALLKRGNMALEDEEWDKANDFFEQVLNLDAECGEAYFGKLLAQTHRANMEAFCEERMRWNVETEELTPYKSDLSARAERAVKAHAIPGYLSDEEIEAHFRFSEVAESQTFSYEEALLEAEAFFSGDKLMTRALRFASGDFARRITEAKDAILAHFEERLENAKQEEQASVDAVMADYADAMEEAERAVAAKGETAKAQKAAREEKARTEAEARRQKEELEAARVAKLIKVAIIAAAASVAALIIFNLLSSLVNKIAAGNQYREAEELLAAGDYAGAADAFAALGDYKDAEARFVAVWDEATGRRKMVSAGDAHTVGLRADGTVVAVGLTDWSRCDVSDWTDIVAISAGYEDTVGLKSDGTVVVTDGRGYSNDDVREWTDIVAISAGGDHAVGLKSDGTVVAVGGYYFGTYYGECDVSGWTGIVAVSAGGDHTVGLKANGTVTATGDNDYGQCDVSDWTDIVAISAGYEHTVGLKSDGTVVAVGANYDDQCDVSEWTDIVAISAGYEHTVGLKSDGTVVAVGANYDDQCDVSDWTDIVSISAGQYHTAGLKSDGTVVAVGGNRYGQCDVSDWTDIKMPATLGNRP